MVCLAITLLLFATQFNICLVLSRYSGSLSAGLLITPEKAALYLESGNKEFYKLKNAVKNHITLAGGQAQTHYEALQVDIVNICHSNRTF